MKEFKGTKGKWEFIETYQHPLEKNEWHSVVQMPNIAISITNTKYLSKQESKANAKLIAAAPEMLEMLQKIKEINNVHNFNGHLINEQIDELLTKILE